MSRQSTDIELRNMVKEWEAKRQKIDKELEALHIAIRINQERAGGGVDAGGRRTSTYAQDLTDAIYDTLSSERPLHRTVILEKVAERGIHVGGAKPVNSIGSYLSTDQRFKNCGRGMWTLEQEPMAQISSADNDAMDATSTPLQRIGFTIEGLCAGTENEVDGFKQDSTYAPRGNAHMPKLHDRSPG